MLVCESVDGKGVMALHLLKREFFLLGDVFAVWSDGEITGGPKIPDKGIEAFDIGVVGKYPLEFIEKRVVAFVGEESGGHRLRKLEGEVLGNTPKNCCGR